MYHKQKPLITGSKWDLGDAESVEWSNEKRNGGMQCIKKKMQSNVSPQAFMKLLENFFII